VAETNRHINSDDSLRSSIDDADAKKALSQSRWSYIGLALPLIGLILAILSFYNLKGLSRIGSIGQMVRKAKFNASMGLVISISLMVIYNGIAFVAYDTTKQNSQNNGQNISPASAFENSSGKNINGASPLSNNTNTTVPSGTNQNTKPTTSNPSPTPVTVPSTDSSSANSTQAINDYYAAQAKAQADALTAYNQCKTDKQNALVSVNQQLADLNVQLIDVSSYQPSGFITESQLQAIRAAKRTEINNQIYTVQSQKNSISAQFSC